jgi:hypothetical protein
MKMPIFPFVRCRHLVLVAAPRTVSKAACQLSGILLLLTSVLGINLSAQAHCGSKLSPFVDGDVDQRLERISELHVQGKTAISMLVGEIDNREIAPVTLYDPFSSQSHLSSPVYCGVVAAYLIELILGRSTLLIKALSNSPALLLGCCGESYVYHCGCIVDAGSEKPIAPDALSQIKAIYTAWWRVNENRGLDELRSDWMSRRHSALFGTNYRWN